MKAKFVDKGIPFIMGEYGAYRRSTPKDLPTHNDAVDYWITFNTRQAIAHGMKPFFLGYRRDGGQGKRYCERCAHRQHHFCRHALIRYFLIRQSLIRQRKTNS
jgi:hypothetical protein